MNKKILLSLVLFCFAAGASAQQIAVKTNLLYWATTSPNIGAEVALSRHSTISLNVGFNPWRLGDNAKIKHWLVQPEYRYWFAEKYTRGFIGLHALGGKYEIGGFKMPFGLFPSIHHGYIKGSAIGCGISYGYQFYISPHWNLEMSLGVGYARVKYNSKASQIYTIRNYIGPTQAGITFVYLFNSKK